MQNIEDNLKEQTLTDIRATIARQAANFDDVFFFSDDLDPRGLRSSDPLNITPGVFLLAARGPENIEEGVTADVTFKGIYNQKSGACGDWTVSINLKQPKPNPEPLSHPTNAETRLKYAPKEQARGILSRLAANTPKTVYVSEDFADGLPEKYCEDGTVRTPIVDAAMYFCTKMKDDIKVGETCAFGFTAFLSGSDHAYEWVVHVKRDTE